MTYAHPASLAGKAVIVTGAARGIGRGIALALAERGASMLLVDLLEDELAATAAEADTRGEGRVVTHAADLRDRAAPRVICAAAVEALGGVDGLVNNAVACNEPKGFADITQEDFDLAYDTGPRATFFLMQAAFPHLAERRGTVVNFGSGSGTGGQPLFGAYASAKEAIRGMSKVAALEWGRHGVRVNVVCPFANSDGIRVWEQIDPDAYARAIRGIPLQRIGDVRDDIGAMVAFLLGDDATYLTGQTILVDGGGGSFR